MQKCSLFSPVKIKFLLWWWKTVYGWPSDIYPFCTVLKPLWYVDSKTNSGRRALLSCFCLTLINIHHCLYNCYIWMCMWCTYILSVSAHQASFSARVTDHSQLSKDACPHLKSYSDMDSQVPRNKWIAEMCLGAPRTLIYRGLFGHTVPFRQHFSVNDDRVNNNVLDSCSSRLRETPHFGIHWQQRLP